jgi:transposase InsO family protein
LAAIGLDQATYYRWVRREGMGELADAPAGKKTAALRATPEEIAAVRRFALGNPLLGYKRLAWKLIDAQLVGLKPHQVYEILAAEALLSRREAVSGPPLKRPEPPSRPDEVWHIDLMYVRIGKRWFYLVDILDGYSRFLVHWSLNPTMTEETVEMTTLEALERLKERRPGEPKIVHDHGSQFLSKGWQGLLKARGATSIVIRVAHPESNGRLERLHRTHREEGAASSQHEDYGAALKAFEEWADYYNWKRPHSSLNYLPPGVYYRGDPEEALAKRDAYLERTAAQRRRYWDEENVSSPATR